MADGVTLDPGAGGATVLTDETAGGHAQIVKLGYSANADATPVGADANGLDVDVTREPATVADGGALPAVVKIVGGYDGSAAQAIATDASGVVQTDVLTLPDVELGAVTLAALESITVVDGGGSLTVDGTVELGATTLAALESITVVDGGGSLTVDGTVTVQDGGGAISVDDNGGSLTVDGSVSLAAAIPAGTNNIGDVDVLTLPGVVGTVAHDAVDSGAPLKTGARARSSDVTAVAADDRVDAIASLTGKRVQLPYALPGQATSGKLNKTDNTAGDVIAAPGAGVRLYITTLVITNAHATVGTKVDIRDGTTAKLTVYAAALGGGATITLPTPLRLTANTALTAICGTTGADVDVSAVGFTAAE